MSMAKKMTKADLQAEVDRKERVIVTLKDELTLLRKDLNDKDGKVSTKTLLILLSLSFIMGSIIF